MGKLFNVHPSDDQLDLYLVGHLSLEHEYFIEEHYLDCSVCLDRLASITDFIAVLKTAVQQDSFPSHAAVDRKPARFAAMLLIAAGTALVCSAPAPSPESPSTFASLTPAKPFEIQLQSRSVRPPTPVRASRPHRVFQPPAQPTPPLVAAELLEIPDDLIIPSGWIGEQISAVMVQQLEPPPLPPFEAKPRWFRRLLAAVRKGFEAPRW
jgi:hypothetical protein